MAVLTEVQTSVAQRMIFLISLVHHFLLRSKKRLCFSCLLSDSITLDVTHFFPLGQSPVALAFMTASWIGNVTAISDENSAVESRIQCRAGMRWVPAAFKIKFYFVETIKVFGLLPLYAFVLAFFLPFYAFPFLSCCAEVFLCDIHFNLFIMHLVGCRWVLDGWKFIKGALITICPLKWPYWFWSQGGITAWRGGLCLESVLLIICVNYFSCLSLGKLVKICGRLKFFRFRSATYVCFSCSCQMLFFKTMYSCRFGNTVSVWV